jgi:hypothetical protein
MVVVLGDSQILIITTHFCVFVRESGECSGFGLRAMEIECPTFLVYANERSDLYSIVHVVTCPIVSPKSRKETL